MATRASRLAVLGLACCLTACTSGTTPSDAPPPPATVAGLAEGYWTEMLRMAPTTASSLGDRSRDGELPDVSSAARERHDAALHDLLRRARALDRPELPGDERVVLETLVDHLDHHFADRRACGSHAWALDPLRGHHVWLPDLSLFHRVDGEQRARDLLARYRGLPRLFGQHADNLRQGLKAGRTPARLVVTRVIEQLDRLLARPVADDPMRVRPLQQAAAPGVRVPSGWSSDLDRALRDDVRPALAAYRAVLADEILPASRAIPGLASLPGGAACYAASVARHTGEARGAEAIHRLGLAEVARIRGEMRAIAIELGHADVDAALTALDADPAQRVDGEPALLEHVDGLLDRALAALPRAFGRLPASRVEVSPLRGFAAPDAPMAIYVPAAAAAGRGRFLLDVGRPERHPLYRLPVLVWHEAVPGHHLQMALAGEDPRLPRFMRARGSTAFVEGWGLYAEALAGELGLYRTPAERLGALTQALWRAARLVVDTGLHDRGWTREQAVAYLREQAGLEPARAESEVVRYVTYPGQALAYTLGRMAFDALRADAEAALGDRFDLRAWHDRVLRDGAIPLPVLRRQMAAWVRSR